MMMDSNGSSTDKDSENNINNNKAKLIYCKHENKNIVEIEINGQLISKNQDDDLINLSQILKLSGMNEIDIDKFLNDNNEEISMARTEIDEGKYKGIWIKTSKAIKLSEKLNLKDSLKALFEVKEDNKKSLTRTFSTMTENDEEIDDDDTILQDNPTSVAGDAIKESPLKKLKLNNNKLVEKSIKPIDINNISNYEELKELISQIFITNNNQTIELSNRFSNIPEIDLPIDVHGNTALHWATSLAALPLIYDLINNGGANVKRGNHLGETALMKAVSHVNYLDNLMFGNLLDVLYPSIINLDEKNRSILHHIVLLAGSEGRSDAAKYYLQCLVEWLIKNGPNKSNAITFTEFMEKIVNLQDYNGDTALNIIARIGNKAISQQLLDIGADSKIPNKAGLTPADFRLTGLNENVKDETIAKEDIDDNDIKLDNKSEIIKTLKNQNNSKIEENLINNSNTSIEINKKISKESFKILNSMNEMMNQLNGNFENELKSKQVEINQLYKELKQSTIKLSESREQLELLKNSESKLNELKQKTSNVEKSIENEQNKFNSEYPNNNDNNHKDMITYDPDQPFRIPEIFEVIKEQILFNKEIKIPLNLIDFKKLPSNNILKARINAYKQNEKYLENLIFNLNENSRILENKFRHVVSLCTGVEENKVDDLLEGLVQAVESDPDEVDLGKVAGFLNKVDDNI